MIKASEVIAEAGTDNADHRKQVARLKRIIEQQSEQLAAIKRKRWQAPKGKRLKQSKTFLRWIIPDSHGCLANVAAVDAMFGDMRSMSDRIAEVVLLGDHLECGGFLSQHHVLGYVSQSAYSWADDIAACNSFLDRVQEIVPKATIHYLEGNHENRIEKWIVDQTLRHSKDAGLLRDKLSPQAVLSIESRNIKYYSSGEFYGLRVPGAIKLDKCHFLHGSVHSANTARVMAKQFAGNVVFGHVHTQQGITDRTVTTGEIGSWCPGCLCELQPLWRHSSITQWSHGYAFQSVGEIDGRFMHLNVPIVDGVSMLQSFSDLL